MAVSLNNLASLFQAKGDLNKAEPLYRRALAIFEAMLGKRHPRVLIAHDNYRKLVRAMKDER